MAVCEACGISARGNYCHICGTRLTPEKCGDCGADLPPSASFCNMCGTRVAPLPADGKKLAESAESTASKQVKRLADRGARSRPAASSRPRRTPGRGTSAPRTGRTLSKWLVGTGSAAMLVVIAVLGTRMAVRAPAEEAETGSEGTPPDISAMTPIEAADRLFNRVMTAVDAGDSAEALQFTPMAIMAYERAAPLNADGLFHLALLQHAAGMFEESLETAESIVLAAPDHLLGLYAIARAARDLGDLDRATEAYARISEVHERERAIPRQEYRDHRPIIDTMIEELKAFGTTTTDGPGSTVQPCG